MTRKSVRFPADYHVQLEGIATENAVTVPDLVRWSAEAAAAVRAEPVPDPVKVEVRGLMDVNAAAEDDGYGGQYGVWLADLVAATLELDHEPGFAARVAAAQAELAERGIGWNRFDQLAEAWHAHPVGRALAELDQGVAVVRGPQGSWLAEWIGFGDFEQGEAVDGACAPVSGPAADWLRKANVPAVDAVEAICLRLDWPHHATALERLAQIVEQRKRTKCADDAIARATKKES